MEAAYIHTGAKVGVLLQVRAGKEDSLGNDNFKVLVKDITLHIAASAPVSESRDEVDPELVAKEKAIAEEQAAGKPPQAIEKIVDGKMNKFFATNCLLEQGFVKNPDISIKDHVASVAQSLGDEITVAKFLRFQVGESF